MVVVTGTWFTTVVPYSPEITHTMSETNENAPAKALLICQPNSHPFQARALNLDQSIKIGRSVARAKPTQTNAIFDCKVLSRHHALLWYEDGKFFLQDTKSSNGTFVNDKRLSAEKHEVFSGDVVQFGVDVVENNRKVTHGCIITTLKLFLPDGTEAKAADHSEGVKHGSIPLDDLYRLRQILQEANQREICLESKLNALQRVVEQTKSSAEECWQVYVGEERLLSRLSALENQLQQARTNWSDDQLKEEITKLRAANEQYQEAAKDALERAHMAKLHFESLAAEEERQKLAAERNALIARETLRQAQQEIQALAQAISEAQASAKEREEQHEKGDRHVQQMLEEADNNIVDLQEQIYKLTVEKSELQYKYEQQNLISDDCKTKEELLAENEIISESLLNKSNANGFENHISLTVAPVEEKTEPVKTEELECENSKEDNEQPENSGKERQTRVSFNLTEDDKDEESLSPVDEKTLKYQYQSAQKERNELRRKIDILEKISETNKAKIAELTKSLSEEKELSGSRLAENEKLRQELLVLEQKWMDCFVQNEMLQSQVNNFIKSIETKKENDDEKDKEEQKYSSQEELSKIEEVKEAPLDQSNVTTVTCEQLMNLEEELVLLKEKIAQTNEEKAILQRDLLKLKVERDVMCDNMYNRLFFYIGPLALIVLYLLISACIS